MLCTLKTDMNKSHIVWDIVRKQDNMEQDNGLCIF